MTRQGSPLIPAHDFNWMLVEWGGPDQRITELCSYCSTPFHEDEMPLILTTNAGWAARFCERCQRKYWGMQCFDDGDDEIPE